MRPTLSLIRREFGAYFLSPIAYVVLFVFLLVTGYRFSLTLDRLTETGPRGVEYPMQGLVGDPLFWLVFLFIPPLLTMRTFAEERATGTLEMLMTAPVRDWQVVFAKFVGCFGFYLLMWLPTLAYLPALLDAHATWSAVWTTYSITMVAGAGLVLAVLVLSLFLPTGSVGVIGFLVGLIALVIGLYGHYTQDQELLLAVDFGIDPNPAYTTYIGAALAGAMFIALGMFVSSLVQNQLVAAIVALVLSLPFVLAGVWRPDVESGGVIDQAVSFISVPLHFSEDFTRGVLDTRHLVLYASTALFFLFLTVRSLESRRWK